MAAHPCDQDPKSPLSCAPAQALRKWLVRNDLRSFTPSAPTLLCGGHADPTVPFFNTTAAMAYFSARTSNVTQLDIDDVPGMNDPFRSAKAGFIAAKDAYALAEGNGAVASTYHAGLVAPFCMAAVRDYFQSILSR
jgi:hypothetical protein